MKLNSTFQVNSKSIINHEDLKVLTLLYLPLLGPVSFSIYLTLLEITNEKTGLSEILTHQEICDQLNIKIEEFQTERNKLEALGLLCVYQKNNAYYYFLKAPLSAHQFLSDTILGTYLQSEIGINAIKKLITLFEIKEISLENSKNITKSFSEVYEFKNVDLLNFDEKLRGKRNDIGVLIESKFDYQKFVDGLPERYKQPHLFNPNFKNMIERIIFVYKFDVNEMVDVYIKATTNGNEPNEHALRLSSNLYFQEHKGDYIHHVKPVEVDEAFQLDRTPPQNILDMFGRSESKGADLDTVQDFYNRNNYPPGILNAIIMFVLKHKDGHLPHVNYLEKVLKTWLNSGVKSTEDAINYMKKIESTYTSYAKSKEKKIKGPIPDWLDEYLDSF